jgi:hypothetical protein
MEFANWTTEEVATKLSKAGLGIFSALFIDKNITGQVLQALTLEDLQDMGISIGGQEMITRWIAGLTPTSLEEAPLHPAPSEESWLSRLDDQYEFMEPQYREGTLRRPCAFCNRNIALDHVDQHEGSCLSRAKPNEEMGTKAAVSHSDPESCEPRHPSQFRENDAALRESIRRAKRSFVDSQTP